MDRQDREVIEGLFSRLGEVERKSGQRDAEAETLIRERVAQQPAAPYLMAQTIVMQEQALYDAQRRIDELERQPRGGFLSGLFGGGSPPARPSSGPPAVAPGPWGGGAGVPGQPGQPPLQQPGRGGFLAGAAQTAMGVVGGMLLGNAIAGLFGGEAKAAESRSASGDQNDSGSFGADDEEQF
jgi:hypothetical protein